MGKVFTATVKAINFLKNPKNGGSPPSDIIRVLSINFVLRLILEELISLIFLKFKKFIAKMIGDKTKK